MAIVEYCVMMEKRDVIQRKTFPRPNFFLNSSQTTDLSVIAFGSVRTFGNTVCTVTANYCSPVIFGLRLHRTNDRRPFRARRSRFSVRFTLLVMSQQAFISGQILFWNNKDGHAHTERVCTHYSRLLL